MQTRYQLRHSPATPQDTPQGRPVRWNAVSIQAPRPCVVLDHHDTHARPAPGSVTRPSAPPSKPARTSRVTLIPVSTASSQHDPHLATPTGKPRARAVGLKYRGTPGQHNAITDVPGVEVGYQTLIKGDNVRTGVTAIHPRGKHNPGDPLAAGYFSLNGNGEMTGVTWIEESGTMQGPIAITNTYAVGIAHAGIIAWMNQSHPDLTDVWLLPVAAETWDGYLNDINGHHVNEEHVVAALSAATGDQPDEGSVGGGTGMNCYQFKGGNGTASRLVEYAGTTYTVGVFLQANFGRRDELTLNGVYLGEELGRRQPDGRQAAASPARRGLGHRGGRDGRPAVPEPVQGAWRGGSASAWRAPAPRGSHIPPATSSSRSPPPTPADSPAATRLGGGAEGYDSLTFVPWGKINPFYEAVVQATEEAVANALIANEDMTGRDGHRSPALPRHRLAEILAAKNDNPKAVPPNGIGLDATRKRDSADSRSATPVHLFVDICRYTRFPSLTLRPCRRRGIGASSMRSTSPVSRPAWVGAMNALTGTGGESRKSPVEIFATAASVVTRTHYAEVTGIKHGKLGRWTDGVAELRAARTEFAAYWDAHNDQVLANRERSTARTATSPTRCGSSSATRPRRASARRARAAATSARPCTSCGARRAGTGGCSTSPYRAR